MRRAMLSQHVNVTFPFTVEEIVQMGAGDRQPAAVQCARRCGAGRGGPRRISATGNCRRFPAASSSARIRPRSGAARLRRGGARRRAPVAGRADIQPRSCATRSTSSKTRAAAPQDGTAVIAILHDLNLAIRVRRPADRALNGGRLAADGGRAESIGRPRPSAASSRSTPAVHQADDGVPYVLPRSMRAAAR